MRSLHHFITGTFSRVRSIARAAAVPAVAIGTVLGSLFAIPLFATQTVSSHPERSHSAGVSPPSGFWFHVRPDSTVSSSALEQELRKGYAKLTVQPVFSRSEQKILRELKREALASTLKIGPVPEIEAAEFQEEWKRRFLKTELQLSPAVQLYGRTTRSTNTIAQDPLFREQWALKNIGQEVRVDLDDIRTLKVPSIPGIDLGLPADLGPLKPIKVAVLDTGMDLNHPDLSPRVAAKADECRALFEYETCRETKDEVACLKEIGNIDRDGNGYPLDCAGWNVVGTYSLEKDSPFKAVLGSPEVTDERGHGTHVSGTVGAFGGNGIGVHGVAPNALLLPVQVIETPPSAPIRPQDTTFSTAEGETPLPEPLEESLKWSRSSVDLIARGMLYAIRENVQVINLSLGWPAALDSKLMREMVALAQERGIAVVAASGNDSTDALVQPCNYPGVICVGAHGPDGKRSHFSNHGAGVDFSAPGLSILSTYPLGLRSIFFTDLLGYDFRNGTSMAAPHVSGAMAVLLGKGMTATEALARLLATLSDGERIHLGAALAAKPAPVFRIRERAPIRLRWNQAGEVLKNEVQLMQLWEEPVTCSVRLEGDSDPHAEISLDSLDCKSWKAGQARKLAFRVKPLSPRIEREGTVTLRITATGRSGTKTDQLLRFQWDLLPTLSLTESLLPTTVSRIEGPLAGRNPSLRTVVEADESVMNVPGYAPLYLSISNASGGLLYQILKKDRLGNYFRSAPQKAGADGWSFLTVQRYRSIEAGEHRLALVFRKKNDLMGHTEIRLEIFDSEFREKIREIEYSGTTAPFPENFRWTTSGGKDAILFLARGKSMNTDDPWITIPDESISLRCYILNSKSELREVIIDRRIPEKRIVQLLPETEEDRKLGQTPLLVVNGRDYVLDYFVGRFADGRFQSITPFQVSPYRNFSGLAQQMVVTDSPSLSTRAFSGLTGRGRMRTTLLTRGTGKVTSSDHRFEPLSTFDGIGRLAAAFHVNGQDSFFVQTTWDLQFHEGSQIQKTSMKRFSFLPKQVFLKSFFPMLTKGDGERSEPSLLVLDIGRDSLAVNTLVPTRDGAGQLTGLSRPALLSFESDSECTLQGNPTWDARAKSHRLNFVCEKPGGATEIRSLILAVPSRFEQ